MNQTIISNNKTDKTLRVIWWSGFIDGIIALPLLVVVVGYIFSQTGGLPAVGRWLVRTNDLHKADAIVVLSGGGAERWCHGIELFKRGLAPELWHTGGRPLETRPDFMDAEMARHIAEQRGVPSEKIIALPSTSTFEDGAAAAALARKQKTKAIMVVTSWYHTRRAVNVLRHCLADQNIAVYASCSTNLPYSPENWWQNDEGLTAVVNEIIKTAFYWRKHGITPF